MLVLSSGQHHYTVPSGMIVRLDPELGQMSYIENPLNRQEGKICLKAVGFTAKMMETYGLTLHYNNKVIAYIEARMW